MKKKLGFVLLIVALACSNIAPAFAEEFLDAKDRASLADLYEQKASEQNAVIAAHERMKKDPDIRRRNPSATQAAEMDRHCDGIINAAKALRKEFLNAAEWNKSQV